ncbi:MAG: hypothetical protein RIQ93_1531 [Verrucomicrobiota bacterium]
MKIHSGDREFGNREGDFLAGRSGWRATFPKADLAEPPAENWVKACGMKSHLVSRLLPAVMLALAFPGCNTFKSRAREKSATFDALPNEAQQRLRRGEIDIGDTHDMVYIALGQPDERRETITSDGGQETWIYRTYWQQYEGTAWAGWRRVVVPASNGRGYIIFHEPVSRDVYSARADDVIRVTLARGVVRAVEQQIKR